MRYNFILNNRNTYSVEKMCKCMKVSKNAYYHWAECKDLIILETPNLSSI